MKTDEEWADNFKRYGKSVERLEHILWVKAIQRDALREAAEIAGRQVQRDMECCPSFNDGLQAGRNEARDAILAKAKEIE